MKLKKIYQKRIFNNVFNSNNRMKGLLPLFFIMVVAIACSEFVETKTPKNLLISETVFNDPVTVESALANIYYKMREQGMVSGRSGLTTLLGIYCDELDYYSCCQ